MTASSEAGWRVFDAHLHIIDSRFPLVDSGYQPPIFPVANYHASTAGLNVVGGTVVSGSFQGFDQRYLLDALDSLGSGFVGVTQLPESTPDWEIVRLADLGVRGIRFNVHRGGSETLAHLESFARRVHELVGWHTELYVDGSDLAELAPRLKALPAVCIDHLGLSEEGLPELARLAEDGAHVKATGFGRVRVDVEATLRTLVRANPSSLMFGTDLPSTRARRPFQYADLDLVVETVGPEHARAVLHDNAAEFYRVNRPAA